MNILSSEFLTMIVLGSLFCIHIKITRINRGLKGITINNKFKIKTSLLTTATVIIVTILLLVTSSGCATKEPTIINQNNNTISQAASEEISAETIASVEEAPVDKVNSAEEITSEEETQTITQRTKPDIEIVHPVEETNWQENIGGIAKNIPDEYELWILVYSQEKDQYYPYTKVVPEYDQWVIKPLIIGFKGDYTKEFDIIAVLADTEAQEIFNNYLYEAEENEENIYSQGMYLIPDGAKEYDRITLSRKGSFSDNTVD